MTLDRDLLEKLGKAIEEGRTTLRELHEARAAARDVSKRLREQIREAVAAEVDRAVAELATEARNRLHDEAGGVIARIEGDWRRMLGLDA